MNGTINIVLAILVIAACTWLTRAVPYLLFGGARGVPNLVKYLATALPEAIMVILVIYCMRNTDFTAVNGWMPQLLALLAVVALQAWKKSAMLSIFAGTTLYMVLIRIL